MTEQNRRMYDIIILGLGPVGLLACNALGKYGYNILGIDRFETTFSFPRAIAMDDEIVRIIQSVGLHDEFYPTLKPINGLELVDKNFKTLFRGKSVFPSGYISNHFLFWQPQLENILRNGCQRFSNVKLLYAKDITDILQNNDSVTIFSGEEKIAQAKYLLGCDGARSFTRNHLGIGINDLLFDKNILKIDAFQIQPTEETFNSVQKICNATTPWVRMNGVGNHKRWELNYTNGLSKEQIEQPETIQKMLREIGVNTDNLQIQHGVLYSVKSVLAKEWQRDNILLAGDSAHTTPPYIGQGMASGFRDIMNLSWKLDFVLQNRMPKSILNTYQTERYPHAKFHILLAVLVGWIFTTRLLYVLKVFSKVPLLKSWLCNFHLPQNPLGKGFWGTGKGKRYLFPQIKIDEKIYSDTLFSNQWTLVAVMDTNKLPEPNIAINCEKVGLKYIALKFNADLQKWAKKNKEQYFIVRPDLYVFSSGNDVETLCNEFTIKTKSCD